MNKSNYFTNSSQTGLKTVSPEYFTQSWVEKVTALETRALRLEQACREKDSTIEQLRTSLIALTEENIHLRAKVSHFNDSKELSMGIEQMNELLQSSKELPSYEPVTESLALTNSAPLQDIDILQQQLEFKKMQYALENKENPEFPPLLVLETPPTPPSIKHAGKVRVSQVKKTRKTRYIPSYLRVSSKRPKRV